MEYGVSCDANSRSVSQEILRPLRNQTFVTVFTTSAFGLYPALEESSPQTHAQFSNIHSKIFVPSRPWFTKERVCLMFVSAFLTSPVRAACPACFILFHIFYFTALVIKKFGQLMKLLIT